MKWKIMFKTLGKCFDPINKLKWKYENIQKVFPSTHAQFQFKGFLL